MRVVRRQRVRTAVLAVVVVLLAILAVQVAWNYHLAPRLAIRRIILDSDLGLSDRQILEMLGIARRTTIPANTAVRTLWRRTTLISALLRDWLSDRIQSE